ncbi:hypothetical protein [Microbacterium sp. JZ31]|nr:hypothetical protein [Microbacterium sp. JZ31]
MVNHSAIESEENHMKNEITIRWVALAPLAVLAVAMFSAWR